MTVSNESALTFLRDCERRGVADKWTFSMSEAGCTILADGGADVLAPTTPVAEHERWRRVAGFEGYYLVSNLGRLWSLRGSKHPPTHLQPNGYLTVGLGNGFINTRDLVHRLVATAFIPNPLNLRTVNHKDGIKTYNAATNLEWASQSTQLHHARHVLKRWDWQIEDRRPEGLTLRQIVSIKARFSAGENPTVLAKEHDVSRSAVLGIAKRPICFA